MMIIKLSFVPMLFTFSLTDILSSRHWAHANCLDPSQQMKTSFTLNPPSDLKPGNKFNYLTLKKFPNVRENFNENITEFAYSVWVKISYFTKFISFFSYATDHEDNAMLFGYESGFFLFINDKKIVKVPASLEPANWIHLGFTISSGELNIYFNGVVIHNGIVGISIPAGGVIVLGQDQDTPNGKFNVLQSFCGQIIEPKIWLQKLKGIHVYEEFSKHTEWEDSFTGNKIFKNINTTTNLGPNKSKTVGEKLPQLTATWVTVGNVTISQAILEGIKYFKVIIPYQITQPEALKMCHYFGLNLVFSRSKRDDINIANTLAEAPEVCMGEKYLRSVVWLSIEKNLTGGTWHHSLSQEVLQYMHLRKEDVEKDSDTMVIGRNTWHAASKSEKHCTMCDGEFPEQQFLLLGICQKNSTIEFFERYDENHVLRFHSREGFVIHFRRDKWELIHIYANLKIGHLLGDYLPIGRKTWKLSPIHCQSFPFHVRITNSTFQIKKLTLSKCNLEQFACNDGSCVDMKFRCNGVSECVDLSDEQNCDLLWNHGQPFNRIPPVNPLNITISAMIRKISQVNLKNQQIQVDAFIQFKWYDPQLQFKNLVNLTAISGEDINSIWKPTFKAINVNHLEQQRNSYYGFIIQESAPKRFDEDFVYEGSGNGILLDYDSAFHSYCNFQLHWYPFDVQNCFIKMRLTNVPISSARLRVNPILKNGELLENYGDIEYSVTCIGVRAYEDIFEIYFALHRDPTYHLFSTYLPTVLLHGIGYGTLFIRSEDFTNRGAMSLTTMLVLISLYTDKMSTLPVTSYLKCMDIWFIFSVAFLSTIISVHLITNDVTSPIQKVKFFDEVKKPSNKTILKVSKFLLGTTYFLFFACYWGIVAVYYSDHSKEN